MPVIRGELYALPIISSLCITIFQDQRGRYGFFEPHSRQPDGLPHGPGSTGTAVMLLFTHLNDLIAKRITSFQMSGSSPSTQYELMPVLFQNIEDIGVDGNLGHVECKYVSNIREQNIYPVSCDAQADIEIFLPSCSECAPPADITDIIQMLLN